MKIWIVGYDNVDNCEREFEYEGPVPSHGDIVVDVEGREWCVGRAFHDLRCRRVRVIAERFR